MEFSTNNYKNALKNYENSYKFYQNEILSDYQKRLKTMIDKLKILPDTRLNHIGVEAIHVKTVKGAFFIDFASNGTIHGMNHLVARRRHPIERFLVTLFIVIALLCLIYVSFFFWYRYQNDATVVILNLNQKHFQVQRPALLICTEQKINETKFSTTFERYSVKDTLETRNFFQFLSNVNYETMHETPDFDAVPPEKWLQILFDLRYDFNPTFGDMQTGTKMWVITERGICLSIRNYVSVYTTLKYWLQDNWTVVPQPKETPFYNYDNDGDIETATTMAAMIVTVYDPGEIIEYQHKRINIQSHTIGQYKISITEIVSAWNVQNLSVNQRKCKFGKDGDLKMWPVYTLKMCIIECRYQTIKQHCECLPHFARPMVGIPVCDAVKLRCIATIKNDLFLYKHMPDRCNCLPNCNDVHYNVEKFTISSLKGNSFLNMSVFNIIVNFPSIMFGREEIFGFNDFLAAVGGAAGLFLGASVLSFIEIFYYITLHMWIYYIKSKQRIKNITLKGSRKIEVAAVHSMYSVT